MKKIHRFIHTRADGTKLILRQASLYKKDIAGTCDKVFDSCRTCVLNGRPKRKRQLFLTHVSEEFNQKLQANIMVDHIRGEKFEVIDNVNLGAYYGERAIVPSQNDSVAMQYFETLCICHYGTPQRFGADPEFTK